MSDKQLTVAELMARAAQEGNSPRESRPRRRRSLDEGGVSVAELTGSIPRVNKKPAESKHSSVPLDAPQERVEEKVAASVDSATSDTMVGAAAGASGGMREAHREPPARPTPQAPQPVMVEPSAPSVQDTGVADASDVDDLDDLDDSLTDEETMVLSVVTEDDPVRLTTGSFPALTAELLGDDENDGSAQYGATDSNSGVSYSPQRSVDDDALTDNEGSGAEDEEIVTKVVFAGDNISGPEGYDASDEYADEDYADEDFADESIDSIAPVEDALPDRYDSEELNRVDDTAFVGSRVGFATGTFEKTRTGQFPEVSDDAEAEADVDDDASADVRAVDSATFRAVPAQEDVESDSEFDEEDDAFDPDFNDEETYEEDAFDEDDELDEVDANDNQKVSVLSVVLMVIIAIAVGVGLFKGFEMLWANMSKIITALLAVAATGAIVGIVHALRTERDGLSMVLAGAAGLAVTFGPLAIVGF
jgi:putative membrane protein